MKKQFSWISVLIMLLLIVGLFSSPSTVQAVVSIPASATITSAILSLHVDTTNSDTVRAHRILTNWDETTVTWNNFGASYDPATIDSFAAAPGAWNSVNVTSLVQGWVNGTVPNDGVLFEQDPPLYSNYESSEAADVTLRPKLEICYTAPGIPSTCVTIQRPGGEPVDVWDAYIMEIAPDQNTGRSSQLYTGMIADKLKMTLIRFDINVVHPAVTIVKTTNGQLATDPNGMDVPQIKPGDPITWLYTVTNTGDVAVSRANLVVSDNQAGVTPVFDKEISGNGDAIFDPGEVWQYKATGTAANLLLPPPSVVPTPNGCTLGGSLPPHNSYVNIGTVTVPGAIAQAPSSYCNAPDVKIVKRTNGQLATDPNGADVPQIKPGDPVVWTYEVTNIGGVPIKKADVVVTDNQAGVTPVYDKEISGNGDAIFDPGEVWQYKATGTAVNLLVPPPSVVPTPNGCSLGGVLPPHNSYVNIGTVTVPGATAEAPSSYCNKPDVTIVKRTNGHLATDPNGLDVPMLRPGDPITWTYVVTNTGVVPIKKADVVVTDNQAGVTPAYDSEVSGNGDAIFDPGEVWLYKASGIAEYLVVPPQGLLVTPNGCSLGGQYPPHNAYVNLGTVTVPGATAQAPSSYCNAPDVKIVKSTNGQLAADPNGLDVPQIKPGDPVVWTYEVTNTGGVPIKKADVVVTDNQIGVTPVYDSEVKGNGDGTFDPGEVWLYKASGTAINLSSPPGGVIFTPNGCAFGGKLPPHNAYINLGTVTIPGANAQASSSYCNVNIYKLYMPIHQGVGGVIFTQWQLALGYEDLPLALKANDFDYNDWTMDINATNSYMAAAPNMIVKMKMDFLPFARGAALDHRVQILIPPGVFKSNGTAVVNLYDKNHTLISTTSTPFIGATGGTYVIFPKTSDALPGSLVNTIEGVPFVAPQRFADLTFTFDTPFQFVVNENDFAKAHGTGLFFDPYLDVFQTGDSIHTGDLRMLTVPSTDYLWPEERVRIDKAYPDITYVPGLSPDFIFPNFWWTNHNHCVYDGVACVLP